MLHNIFNCITLSSKWIFWAVLPATKPMKSKQVKSQSFSLASMDTANGGHIKAAAGWKMNLLYTSHFYCLQILLYSSLSSSGQLKNVDDDDDLLFNITNSGKFNSVLPTHLILIYYVNDVFSGGRRWSYELCKVRIWQTYCSYKHWYPVYRWKKKWWLTPEIYQYIL